MSRVGSLALLRLRSALACVMPVAMVLMATTAARAAETLTGCFPITLDDVAPFNAPAFERYPGVDANNGKVFFPPNIESVSTVRVDLTSSEPEPTFVGLRFRDDSRMLVVIGAQNDDTAKEGIGYYEWTGNELKRIEWFESDKTYCED